MTCNVTQHCFKVKITPNLLFGDLETDWVSSGTNTLTGSSSSFIVKYFPFHDIRVHRFSVVPYESGKCKGVHTRQH